MNFTDIIFKIKTTPPYKRNRIIVIFLVGVFVLSISVGVITNFSKKEDVAERRSATLIFWDFLDNEDAYRELIQKFIVKNPGVTIKYEKKKVERYGEKSSESYRYLITNALASGEGPDIYIINNNWLPMENNRIVPLNEVSDKNTALLVSEFPDVVRFDFTREDTTGNPILYSLPLSIDTLALYYNVDYFNGVNIVNPPVTWDEFVEVVKKISRFDEVGNLQLAGVAMGAADTDSIIEGGDNINNAVDILSLLMIQAGAQMNDPINERVSFSDAVRVERKKLYPARDAFEFYTSFANSSSENYAWDPNGFFSIDAFSNGTAAMMINYSYHIDTVRDKNPRLNFKIAPIPQPKDRFDKVTYADYWSLVVAKNSKNPDIAWKFITFITQEENAKIYLKKTNRPPALKSLINEYKDNFELDVFAGQLLSARSWIQPNAFETERILNQAIEDILTGEDSTSIIVSTAQNKVNVSGREF